MKFSRIKDYIVMSSSLLCLGVVVSFCFYIGISYSPKTINESFSFENKTPEILKKEYLLQKGNIDIYQNKNAKLNILENSFVNYEFDSTAIKPCDIVAKDQIIGSLSGSDIKANGKGIVTDVSNNKIQIYYFNSFEVVVTFESENLFSFDYKSIEFKASINSEILDIKYDRIDLSRIGTEYEFDVYFTCNNSNTIVTANSLNYVNFLLKRYSNVLYINDKNAFKAVGERKVFSTKDADDKVHDFFLDAVDVYEGKWVVECFENLGENIIIYGE